MEWLKALNSYNGLITAVATIVLVIITYIYMLETKKQRLLNEKIFKLENSQIIIEDTVIQFIDGKKQVSVEFKLKNIGSKPARNIEFKILTKRSPKECISQFHFIGSKEEYKNQLDEGKMTYSKTKDTLMSGQDECFYTEILTSLLDYDKSFYLWVKYRNFYNEIVDEIRWISLAQENCVSETNINMVMEYNKKYNLPVSYR